MGINHPIGVSPYKGRENQNEISLISDEIDKCIKIEYNRYDLDFIRCARK